MGVCLMWDGCIPLEMQKEVISSEEMFSWLYEDTNTLLRFWVLWMGSVAVVVCLVDIVWYSEWIGVQYCPLAIVFNLLFLKYNE